MRARPLSHAAARAATPHFHRRLPCFLPCPFEVGEVNHGGEYSRESRDRTNLITLQLNHPGGFRSRRSYPNLHHVSLAPLTPKFPIDDDTDPADYFSQNDDDENTGNGARTPPRTSYISSVSVPSTPPILSHSRSTSRSRHGRSKSSTSAAGLSDTNLQSRAETLPLHHQPGATKKRPSSSHARRTPGESSHAKSKSDAEWMLRAGIALASSTREEKGQSWLSKRESSTSLVSMPHDDAAHHHRHHHRTKSGSASSRKSRSGASTPAAYSRRSSRATSRRGSRAGLTMTTMPPSSLSSAAGKAPSPGTGTPSPEMSRRSSIQVPGFVDERIRAEMASLQERERLLLDDESEYLERDDENSSEYSYSSDDTQDEFDEADLQRLTRERGFGLGSWIDRLVEWTLFGVDEWPAPMSPAAAATRIGATPTTTTVTFEDPPATPSNREQNPDTASVASTEGDHHSDDETVSHAEGDSTDVEKPGSQGGWEDASWLFRVVKRALI